MKEYPYIGKGKNNGHIYLVVSNSAGYIISGSVESDYGVFIGKLHTEGMKDVTKGYLEDGMIKVLSPEHSKYLQKIAFRYGFSWCSVGEEVQHTEEPYLYFYPDNDITFSNKKDTAWKEIFIPLPESVTEFRVGDNVSLRYRHDLKGVRCTGKLLYLSDKHIIVEDSDGNDIHKLKCDYDIEEALSEEELLLKSLEYDIQTSIDNGDTVYGTAYKLLQEYSITKKPQ